MTIVLPHGVLFRGDAEGSDGEGKIRKSLIEKNHIDAIIGLPANVFFGTGIATIVMVLKQPHGRSDRDDVLFIDASKGFDKIGKNNKLRASDIKKIADTIVSRKDIPKFSRKVSRDEIRKNGWNLNIPRYVDSSDEPETWDLYSTMFGGIPKSELNGLKPYWDAFHDLWNCLFIDDGTPFVKLATDDVRQTILNNSNIKGYFADFANTFDGFDGYLNQSLIGNMATLNISRQDVAISEEIFQRLSQILLVDKYTAYQVFNNEWVKIVTDLEIIQTEGFEAIKVVDPNMITKKKGDKEVEVQEGWIGRIIPFELVQATLLKKEADALRTKESRIKEISAELEELIESITEEEKEEQKNAFNENGDFVKSHVIDIAKSLRYEKPEEHSLNGKIVRARKLFDEDKELKKKVKEDAASLHMQTKRTIEGLSDEQALTLLDLKWIKPITAAIDELPHEVIANLVTKIATLADKYATTYVDVREKIDSAKNKVASLIEGLKGNDFDMKGLGEFQSLLRAGGKNE